MMKFTASGEVAIHVEQGMVSPRDNSITWRYWAQAVTVAEAKKEIRKMKNGHWRIVETRELFTAVSE